jgi:hypothetical protein
VAILIDKHKKDYASYAGYYQYKPSVVDTFFVKDGKLFDKIGGDEEWNFPVKDNEYMVNNGLGRISFGKDSKGVVAYYTATNSYSQQWKCPKIK